MIYVGALAVSVLGLLNLYASWKVLRDGLSTKTQKLMQLGFVWLLPIFGAVLAVSLISGTRHPAIDFDTKRMNIEDWHYWIGESDYGQTEHTSSLDHSCE